MLYLYVLKPSNNDPHIAIKRDRANPKHEFLARNVEIPGPCKLVSAADNSQWLGGGIRVWLEVPGKIIADGKEIE